MNGQALLEKVTIDDILDGILSVVGLEEIPDDSFLVCITPHMLSYRGDDKMPRLVPSSILYGRIISRLNQVIEESNLLTEDATELYRQGILDEIVDRLKGGEEINTTNLKAYSGSLKNGRHFLIINYTPTGTIYIQVNQH